MLIVGRMIGIALMKARLFSGGAVGLRKVEVSATALMATGKSLGPMKTSATTPMRAISDQAKSNMAFS